MKALFLIQGWEIAASRYRVLQYHSLPEVLWGGDDRQPLSQNP